MLKFLEKTEKTAKSLSEAKQLALLELGVTEEEAEIEVIDEGNKGFLGLGAKEACVRAKVSDAPAAAAKKFLSELFEKMGIEITIKAKTEENILNIELIGDDMGIVIGKRGDTLDSLQYLTSLAVNSLFDGYIKVMIDAENYRQKRYDTLIALSKRLGDKVARTGRKQTLEPMNPYERRIIHANLQSNDKVTTYSIGEEPYRKVVIAPKNPRQYGRRTSYGKSVYDKSSYNTYSSSPDDVQDYENEYNVDEDDSI